MRTITDPMKAASLEITQAEELFNAAMTQIEAKATKQEFNDGRIVIKVVVEGLT